ncbi:MAG: hypothetical protein HY074_00615 [Deltaproteobacteria bacterium]|nr:hypothetical protein [Deltaproteobacteria bacterium]
MKTTILSLVLMCASTTLYAAPPASDQATTDTTTTGANKDASNAPNTNTANTNNSNVISNQKLQLQAHSEAIQTFLNVTLQYLDGLDRQLKTDAPLSNATVQEHVNIYTQKSLDALKNARAHLVEYQGVITRAPAAEKDSQDSVSKARASLDKALTMDETLGNRLQVQHTELSIDAYRKQLSDVQSQVKDALSAAKSLKTS